MTPLPPALNLAGMKRKCSPSPLLVAIAFTAVISLAIGHSIDLGTQMLGSGPASTVAVVGDIAALICCALSVPLGRRFASVRA
jgi:hypothetical protein